ncbi:MAG: 2-amino-4-hydroxy-6-hydroxymethyldihydropteridine diphosphokinase [Nanoarchaeota archaeon]|nr:2-amino-4-hydroxy-6-hydroxymethyldihydropteridine diphosphokinase [Nanoarchaeota archaeon]
MIDAYLGIGSNLGEREKNIEKAILLLAEKVQLVQCSSLYQTEPIGYQEQDWFLNCAIGIQTNYEPSELHHLLQNIEVKIGRIRDIPNGPRIIDLDLLLYGDCIFKTEKLEIPHPRLHLRRFVLVPLQEIAAEVVHPILQNSISGLLSDLEGEKNDQVHLYRKNKY